MNRIFVFLILISAAWCSEAHDADSHGTTATSGTSFTWNHTVTGTNPVLVVALECVCLDENTIGVVTYNSANLHFLGARRDGGGSEMFTYLYAGAGVATGTHAIVVNFAHTLTVEYVNGGAASFTGINQSYPWRIPNVRHSGSSTGTTDTATCNNAVSGDFVVGAGQVHTATITADGTQTAIFTENAFSTGQSTSWGAGYIAAATRKTLTWTQSPAGVYSAMCVALVPDTETPTIPQLDTGAFYVHANTSSSLTITSFPVGSGLNRLLICNTSYYTGTGDNTITGMTFNSAAMTKLDANRVALFSHFVGTETYYMKSPTNTSANVVVSASGNMAEFVASCESWLLVDQSSTFGTVAKANSTTAATPSVTVTSQTGAIVHDTLWIDDSGTSIGDMQESGSATAADRSGPGESGLISQVKTGAASVTMSWTGSSAYNTMGFGINFSSASGNANQFPRMQ